MLVYRNYINDINMKCLWKGITRFVSGQLEMGRQFKIRLNSNTAILKHRYAMATDRGETQESSFISSISQKKILDLTFL